MLQGLMEVEVLLCWWMVLTTMVRGLRGGPDQEQWLEVWVVVAKSGRMVGPAPCLTMLLLRMALALGSLMMVFGMMVSSLVPVSISVVALVAARVMVSESRPQRVMMVMMVWCEQVSQRMSEQVMT
jgi:hypothetical protein